MSRWLWTWLLLWTGLAAQAPAHLSQVVEQAVPSVTWATPAPIAFGTALGATELNATSPLSGTFVYTPAFGAVLPAGQQVLKAVFTPADANYKATTAQVTLTVLATAAASFEIGMPQTAAGEIVWAPGDSVPLWVGPIGDFHQPVTLSCSASAGYRCSLNPQVVRPVDAKVPVRLTVSRAADEKQPRPLRIPGGPLPGLVLAAIALRRKRLRGALGLVLLAGMAGCGTSRTAVITVTGASLTETKTLVLHLVDSR